MRESIQYMLRYVHSRIPAEILQLVFMQNNNPYALSTSIDDHILTKVIHDRVLPDCNIVSGKIKYIPLMGEYVEFPTDTNYTFSYPVGDYGLYRIPPEARENVPIQSVMSISNPVRSMANYMPGAERDSCPYVTMNQMANQVLESKTMAHTPPLPVPELLSGDLVRLNPPQFAHANFVLACKLAFDPELTNMAQSALIPFAELCLYATQIYIRNEMIIKLDKSFIQGGAEIETIRTIIESYQDSIEKYDEALLKFRGGAVLDTRTKMVLLSNMM